MVDIVANSVDFVADTVDSVASVYGAKVTRSTLSTFKTVESTVLNSTLSPVCTGLYYYYYYYKKKDLTWRLVNRTTRARYNVKQKTEANGRKRTVRGRSGRTALSSAAA